MTAADGEPIDALVALTEDDLSSVVRRREQRPHAHPRRRRSQARIAGSLEREAFVADGQLSLDRTWKAGKMRAVAWLQGRRTRHVYGAATAALVTMTARA